VGGGSTGVNNTSPKVGGRRFLLTKGKKNPQSVRDRAWVTGGSQALMESGVGTRRRGRNLKGTGASDRLGRNFGGQKMEARRRYNGGRGEKAALADVRENTKKGNRKGENCGKKAPDEGGGGGGLMLVREGGSYTFGS